MRVDVGVEPKAGGLEIDDDFDDGGCDRAGSLVVSIWLPIPTVHILTESQLIKCQ